MSAERRARAHTLLEVLIAMSAGLLVLAAVGSLFQAQRLAQRRADDAFRMRDAASTALTLVGQQIQMAGFRPLDADTVSPVAPLFGCASARVRGPDSQPWCEAMRGASDSLLVRYVGDTVSTWPTATGHVSDCLGQSVGAPGERSLVSNRFDARVSQSTGGPELYCEGNGRRGIAQPVVAGVDQLRFRYLRHGETRFADASTMRADDWRTVIAVHVCVRASGESMPVPVRYSDCDGNVVVPHDGRARLTLSRIVTLRNTAGDPGSGANADVIGRPGNRYESGGLR